MTHASIPRVFAEITAKLEDLHAVAVEGQRRDNAPDMQIVLSAHLLTGLASLDGTVRTMSMTLEGDRS